ncbi:transposase [Gracilibacillus alcaliphilus]|nr:transposase [Gracilibacillus alcaliphilus]
MKGMSQALRLGKSVHDNGWGMFTAFLSYKLKEQGKQLVKIDKYVSFH